MRRVMAGLVIAGVSIALAGCGSGTDDGSTTSAAATTSAEHTDTPSPTRPGLAGPNKTINDYITENKIAESPIKPGEPDTPDFDFPFPPGWSDAGDKTPAWAYGAIVYDKPTDPADPPVIIAIASRLTGNVDPDQILEYAPGQLKNLAQFEPLGEPEKTTLGGFEAVRSSGTYTADGKRRVVAQKTVVIPGTDALFVLQLNAHAPEAQKDVVVAAADLINEQTKITP